MLTIDLRELTDILVEADLVPGSAELTDLSRDGLEVVKVELPATDPRKVHWLTNWLDVLMDPIDMVAGQFRRSDDLLRLNIRGRLNNGTMAIVVAPFSKTTDPAQIAAILATAAANHDRRGDLGEEVHELVDQLAELDTRGEA